MFLNQLTAEEYEPEATQHQNYLQPCGDLTNFHLAFLLEPARHKGLHLEKVAEDGGYFFFPTDIKHRTQSCSEEFATRHKKKITKNFGKTNNGDRNLPFFAPKAIRTFIPQLPHFYLKTTKLPIHVCDCGQVSSLQWSWCSISQSNVLPVSIPFHKGIQQLQGIKMSLKSRLHIPRGCCNLSWVL